MKTILKLTSAAVIFGAMAGASFAGPGPHYPSAPGAGRPIYTIPEKDVKCSTMFLTTSSAKTLRSIVSCKSDRVRSTAECRVACRM